MGRMEYTVAFNVVENNNINGDALLCLDNTRSSSESSKVSRDCPPSLLNSGYPEGFAVFTLSAAKWMARPQKQKIITRILHTGFMESLPIPHVLYAFSKQRDDVVVFDMVENLFAFPSGDHQFHLAQAAQMV